VVRLRSRRLVVKTPACHAENGSPILLDSAATEMFVVTTSVKC
jgi:hypothetical protein